MRTIELNIDMKRIEHGNADQIFIAIGRMAAWGLDGYPNCRIYNDGQNDLVAIYSNPDGRKFTMGAVWRAKSNEYTFHS